MKSSPCYDCGAEIPFGTACWLRHAAPKVHVTVCKTCHEKESP